MFEERQHVVVGVSPGNGYFQVPLLTDLLGWLSGEFARVDVVVPDSALPHTYAALGYDPKRAARKARGEINALRNRVVRAWAANGGPRDGDHLHMMSALETGPVYRKVLRDCERALEEDPGLLDSCRATSEEVLLSHCPPGVRPTDGAIDRGMRYLLAELPFFLASAAIFDAPSSLCFYHRPLAIAHLLFSKESVLRVPPHQGYALIRPAGTSPAQSDQG